MIYTHIFFYTPLMWAAYGNPYNFCDSKPDYMPIIKILCSFGADIRKTTTIIDRGDNKSVIADALTVAYIYKQDSNEAVLPEKLNQIEHIVDASTKNKLPSVLSKMTSDYLTSPAKSTSAFFVKIG